ncbi:MAG: sulfatase-like hydrolase/transferase [Phycisphaerales bacterium]|nr:MAG: sulfatase-like hydrolase/transferase [Phycisphaerales bacterium]
MKRREFLRAVGLAATSLVASPYTRVAESFAAEAIKGKTNIVIALADDLGYGDLGCYGHPDIRTPNLDKFASAGLKLTDCYAPSPLCSPARVGMLTGRTPYRCGIYDYLRREDPMHLKKEEVTVATLLKESGYATCHVGKWHCTGKFNSPEQPQPDEHGFEYWFSTGMDSKPTQQNPENFVRNGKPVGPLEGYSSTLIVREAINWLKNRWDRKRPFCLFVWFHAPHEYVRTAAEFMDMYKGRKEAIYYGNVTQMDYEFGRLMKTMDEMKLRDKTFVMFTSDNGPEGLRRYRKAVNSFGSAGPLRAGKLSLYEGGIRVPGIIRWPGRVKAGSVCREPVNGTDVLPTLCAIAGVDVPAARPIDGANILPIFEGKKLERKVPLYWRYDLASSRPFNVAMRQGDWKILADNKMTKFRLYNLAEDIAEKHNVAESYPEKTASMKQTLIRLNAEIEREGPKWDSKWKPPKAK